MIAGALVLGGCGGDGAEGPPREAGSNDGPAAITFSLHEENRSGRHGEVILRPTETTASAPGSVRSRATQVSIRLDSATGDRDPAHIHNVTCAKFRDMSSFDARLATVVDGLSSLEGGRSDTVVNVELAARTNGRYSVNVHKPAPSYDVIACGDIPRR